jgi:hypothetical protein
MKKLTCFALDLWDERGEMFTWVRVRGVYTNTLPVDAYHGAGR